MFEAIVDPILSPLLKLNPLLGIAIISFILTLLITLIHKFVTNQEVMKGLKKDMKDHQDEMKKHKNDPKKVMEIQKKVMEKNMEFMKHSFKPMIFTFIPIIIIFGWLNANMAYYPIMPDQEFEVTLTFDPSAIGKEVTLNSVIANDEIKDLQIINGATQKIESVGIKKFFGTKWVGVANWKLKGPEGAYTLTYLFDGEEYDKDIIITNERKYEPVEKRINDGSSLKSIKIGNEPIRPLNLFGWKVGWLGTYIIFSIVFSMIIRKALNVA